MNEVEALAREMRNRQRRLLDSLNDLKENLTRDGLEAVLKELKKVEDLLRSLMETLSQLADRLPDEFINSPAVGSFDYQMLPSRNLESDAVIPPSLYLQYVSFIWKIILLKYP